MSGTCGQYSRLSSAFSDTSRDTPSRSRASVCGQFSTPQQHHQPGLVSQCPQQEMLKKREVLWRPVTVKVEQHDCESDAGSEGGDESSRDRLGDLEVAVEVGLQRRKQDPQQQP